MTANDSQDFAHEFTPTNRFGRPRPNLSTTLPRFSKTRAGSCPLGQCTVTSSAASPSTPEGSDAVPRVDGAPEAVDLLCLLYTSDAADDLLCVDLGGRRIIKKK